MRASSDKLLHILTLTRFKPQVWEPILMVIESPLCSDVPLRKYICDVSIALWVQHSPRKKKVGQLSIPQKGSRENCGQLVRRKNV